MRARATGWTTYAAWPAELRPGVLEDLGLISALAVPDQRLRGAQAPASVRRVIGPGLPALSPDAELVVYRVPRRR